MTSVSTFACLQMLALRDVSPALNCQLHVHRARMAVHFSAGRALENLGSRDRIGQYCSASRDGHQIHPLRVTRIDSVKINPSLVMMRECIALWLCGSLVTSDNDFGVVYDSDYNDYSVVLPDK